MSTDERRDALRKAIEAYTAEGPDDGPNDGPEEKALAELLTAIEAFDASPRGYGDGWRRIMAAVSPFLTASADQVRDLRVAWEAFDGTPKTPPPEPRKPVDFEESWGVGAELNTPEARAFFARREEPSPRKPVAGWRHVAGVGWMLPTPIGEAWAYGQGTWSAPRANGLQSADTLESAQLAAEDALFAIADAINALRGGRA